MRKFGKFKSSTARRKSFKTTSESSFPGFLLMWVQGLQVPSILGQLPGPSKYLADLTYNLVPSLPDLLVSTVV